MSQDAPEGQSASLQQCMHVDQSAQRDIVIFAAALSGKYTLCVAPPEVRNKQTLKAEGKERRLVRPVIRDRGSGAHGCDEC